MSSHLVGTVGPSRPRVPRHFRPSIERLEGRAVPAVSTAFNPLAGQLTITGDAANDTIVISGDAGGNILVNGMALAGVSLATAKAIVINAGAGDDFVSASGLLRYAGAVHINGQLGRDTLIGSPGKDTIQGWVGDDSLHGGAGDDWIDGWDGLDTIHGGPGNDELHGGAGNDNLYGEAGDDRLNGWDGNDGLFGGAGRDRLTGGAGADRFLDYTWLQRTFIPFPRPFGGRTGYYATARAWQDTIADPSWGWDARVGFENGGRVTLETEIFAAGTWKDSEVQTLDDALATLHRATGNTRLLKRMDGSLLHFVRHGDPVGPSGTGAWNWNGVIHLPHATLFTTHAGSPDLARQLVLHEVGHHWGGYKEAAWRALSGWTRRGSGTAAPPPGYQRSNDPNLYYLATAQFVSDYARANPSEDFAESFANYFMNLGGFKFFSVDFDDIPNSTDVGLIPGKHRFFLDMAAALSRT